MSQFFYKINESTALHVASFSNASFGDIYSGCFAYSDSMTSGSSHYENLTRVAYTNNGYPNSTLTGTSSAKDWRGGCDTFSQSSDTTSIYSSAVTAVYNNFKGSATEFNMLDFTEGDRLVFCNNKGQSIGLCLEFSSIPTTAPFDFNMKLIFDNYTIENFLYPLSANSSLEPNIYFYFISDGKTFGVAMNSSIIGNYRSYYYNFNQTYFRFFYYDGQQDSPYLAIFRKYDAIYGVSGSDIDSSEAGGASSFGGVGGGGVYSFDNSDISSADDMPSSSPAISAGLVNPYYVTASEIASLGNFLWSSDFFDSIAKTFSNPMDCIISLASFPLASSSMSLGSSESVRVGNTTSSSTGTRLISEFVTIDCGTVSIPEVWGSYLDYAQTKLYIYIPYLGIEELPLCECMGGTVACVLRINLLTGALVACVTLTSGTYVTGSARVQPIYFSTTCKSDIPVSGATTGALAGAFQLLGGATSAIAGVATGTAPLAISGLASAAQGVATMQSQNSQISGAVGAAGGQMAHKIPFLIFDRPVQSVPANLASVAGYQSNSGTTLSRCSGFVICDTINLDGLALTRSELEEVEQICTSGVYIS